MLDKYHRTTQFIIVIALAVFIWIVGVIIGQEQAISIIDPEGGLINIISRTRTISVNLMVDNGNGSIKVFQDNSFLYGKSVLDLLQKLNADKQISMQIIQNKQDGFISSFILNGLLAKKQGKTWLVWVNHQLQTEAINKVLLKANDFIELKYINLQD